MCLGNVHEVSLRDKAIIAYAIDLLARGKLDKIAAFDCDLLPFSTMELLPE